jgi:hypothetical protein
MGNVYTQARPAACRTFLFSPNRKIERTTCDSVTFHFIAAGNHPEACEPSGIEPLIALGREEYRLGGCERFGEPGCPTGRRYSVARMAHRLKTKASRVAYDALRKQTVGKPKRAVTTLASMAFTSISRGDVRERRALCTWRGQSLLASLV